MCKKGRLNKQNKKQALWVQDYWYNYPIIQCNHKISVSKMHSKHLKKSLHVTVFNISSILTKKADFSQHPSLGTERSLMCHSKIPR